MVSKNIFKSNPGNVPDADVVNEAGGAAYALSDKAALTQYALTGTFNHTFYASDTDQLKKVLELADKCPIEYVAKLAVYARERGLMKDMPAVLAAYVSVKDVQLFKRIFPAVCSDMKMVRNYVQVIRSGVAGRKSFGSAPKKLIRNYLTGLSDEQLFRSDIGNDPSLADVIRMVRPKAANPTRNALYAHIIGKDKDIELLPALVKEFAAFKKDMTLPIPDVPFLFLTALDLKPEHWKTIARRCSWTQARMNLNTFRRHNVFDDKEIEEAIAVKLENPDEVRRARAFPYSLFVAYQHADDLSARLKIALHNAMEEAINNVPAIEEDIAICLDVSGSMTAPVTGTRLNAKTGKAESFTTKARCIDVASLMTAAIVRKNRTTTIVPFDTAVRKIEFNPMDSVITNSQKLAAYHGGGTDCGCSLAHLNATGSKAKVVILLSDNQSWIQSVETRNNETSMAREWATYKHRVKDAKLINIDVAPYGNTQLPVSEDTAFVGGFSDQVFDIVASFVRDGGKDTLVATIDGIGLGEKVSPQGESNK